jgi:hypothetical protein
MRADCSKSSKLKLDSPHIHSANQEVLLRVHTLHICLYAVQIHGSLCYRSSISRKPAQEKQRVLTHIKVSKALSTAVRGFHSGTNPSLVHPCRLLDFETSACIPIIDTNCDTAKRFTESAAIVFFRLYTFRYSSHHHETIP